MTPDEIAKVAKIGATLYWLGGNCPVQGEGEVDGHAFYFRARGNEWQFHVAMTDEQIFHDDVFYHEQEYGDEEYAAGWMPVADAGDFIVDAIQMFRAHILEQQHG